MKIGIIGCGGIAFGKHMPNMKKDGGFEILAFCDVIAERAEKAAKEYGVEGARVLRRRGVPTHGVFQNEYEQGGGCLVDVGTHALDTVLWLMNNYAPAYAAGSVYHKLSDLPEEMQGNPLGSWTKESFQVEDSAFGYIVMKNGATVLLETSWALNMLEGEAVQYQLCGTKGGCDNFTVNGKLRINGVKNGVQFIEEPSFAAGGVAFYDGKNADPRTEEQRVFREACEGRGELTVHKQPSYISPYRWRRPCRKH